MSTLPHREGRGRFTLALALSLAVTWALGPAHAAGEPAYRGRVLVEVLQELQEGGLDLIFSTAVVHPALQVTIEPSATEPRELLEQILAPLNLRTQDGPGASILILPAAGRVGKLRGRVLSAARRSPIEGAEVSVAGTGGRAVTDEAGYFKIDAIPEGTYEVTIEAFGFLPATIPGVRVRSASTAPLNVELDNHPAFVKVVVTPGLHSLVRQEQASIHSMTSEDSALAPAVGNDVSRVIEQLPGIAAADNSAAFHARGSVTEDVSWVLDGLELYDPFHLTSFQSPYSLVDSNVIDRIDFFGGGFTAELGDRHGGFVEIDTLVPGEAGTGEVELGTVNTRVAYSAPMSNPGGSWLVSLRGWYPNAVTDSIEIGNGENFEPYFGDLYAKASWVLSPRTVLSAHGLLVYDRLTFRETDEQDINEEVDVLTRNSYGWLRLLTASSTNWTQETMLSFGRIDRRRDGVSAAEESVDVDDDRKVSFFGVKHDAIWQISGAHVLKMGIDLRRLDARYDYSNQVEDDPESSVLLDLDPDGTSYSLYAAHRFRVSESFTTELGLRWDRQGYTSDDQFSPRFNAVWRPMERSELRLAVGRFTQSQRIHELHVEDGETEFNPSEAAEQVELSFLYAFPDGPRLRFDAYYSKVSDLRTRYENLFEPIELFPETTQDRVEISPSEARLRGLEILLRGAPNRSFFWRASYTLSSADDKIDGDYVPRSWDQKHAGKFLIGYQWADRWSASLAGVGHTGWPTTPVSGEVQTLPDGSTEIEPIPEERNSDKFPTYYRFDLQARRSFTVTSGRIHLTLDIANLANRSNVCCINDFYFTLRPDGSVDVETVSDGYLGRTGSFSVVWEFGRQP